MLLLDSEYCVSLNIYLFLASILLSLTDMRLYEQSDGLLCDPSGWFITKPCTLQEIKFYESSIHHPAVMRFMPQMLGQLEQQLPAYGSTATTAALVTPTDTPAMTQPPTDPSNYTEIRGLSKSSMSEAVSTDPGQQDDWMPAHGTKITTDLAIVIENIACGFKRPSIIDIKLGSRLWADDAPPAKRRRLDEVSQKTTSGSLGFRIAGMKVWVGKQGTEVRSYEKKDETIEAQKGATALQSKVTVIELDGYQSYDRWYGRSLTSENVDVGFRKFLSSAGAGAHDHTGYLATRIASSLRQMQSALEAEESRMYSSSVLIIYEGDPEALDAAIAGEEENERLRKEKHSLEVDESDGEDSSEGLSSDLFQITSIPAETASTSGSSRPLTIDLNTIAATVQSAASTENVRDAAAARYGVPTAVTTMNIDDIQLGMNDGDDDEEDEDDEPPKVVEVRLIDFAHADWTPGQGPDQNVLHGLRSAASIFEKIALGG
ncbi:hypothetical protein KEM54_002991 [Ascosphaera aggregata]|nr:hypothetical protein KEM54_002991 [Ascosphaera aggregata]